MRITTSEIKNAVLGGIIGIILTAIWDFIKQVPIFSTLSKLPNWFWSILNYKIAVWIFIVFIMLWNFIKIIIQRKSSKEVQNNSFDFLNYTEDEIDGNKWRWNWKKHYTGKYVIENLSVLCPNCNTPMKFDYYLSTATCPRCNSISRNCKNPDNVQSVIIDNLNRENK